MIADHQPNIFDGKKVIAAVSSKSDGNFKPFGDNQQKAIANRQKWLQKIGILNKQLVVANVRDPAAWDIVCDVDERHCGSGVKNGKDAILADVIITNKKGVALGLLTGDCNPVVIFDPKKTVLALAHLGWQSTVVDLASKTVQHMQMVYGCNPKDLQVYNGPSVRVESYVFDPPVKQMSVKKWQLFCIKINDKIGIDLVGYNTSQLVNAGVLPKNIQICPVDTAKSLDYFSHYRATRQGSGDIEGRFMTACMLV
ncbi:MAG: laccase domain-containing protein [Candidatus Woesebacteria bacterium]|jgi:copper oxidase (laccase) domain-containing protein